MLISVSGVGPKAALSILSELSPEKLALCIATGDSKSITRAQGVGPKLAQRVVLELKDKFSSSGEEYQAAEKDGASDAVNYQDARSEAAEALISLGYTRGEAMSALSGIKDDTYTSEDYIKLR